MRTAKLAVALCLFLVAHVSASGRTGVYAVIEKVVFEPNEANAERIQLWGAFSFVGQEMFPRSAPPAEATSNPVRGYFYFSMPKGTADQIKVVRNEWTDLKAMAGTGQAVSFGQWNYMGVMGPDGPTGGVYVSVQVDEKNFQGYPLLLLTLAPPRGTPTPYVTNTGLVKLPAEGSHAATVKRLRDALAPGATR
jgi:hypothetical protein